MKKLFSFAKNKLFLLPAGLLFAVFFLVALIYLMNHIKADEVIAPSFYLDAAVGDDTSSGTSQNSPWKTLAKLNSEMQAGRIIPGSTVFMKSGNEYAGFLGINASGESNRPIVFRSYGDGSKPIINATGNLHGVDIRNGVHHLQIRDLVIRNATNDGFFLYNGANDISLDNIEIASTVKGINIHSGNTHHITMNNLQANSLGFGLSIGAVDRVSDISISNATLSGNSNYGLYVNSGSRNISGLTVNNSTLNNNHLGGVSLSNIDNITLSNIILTGNNAHGLNVNNIGDLRASNITADSNNGSGVNLSNSSRIALDNSSFSKNNLNGLTLANDGSNLTVTNTVSSENKNDGFGASGSWHDFVFDSLRSENNGVDGVGADGDGYSFHQNCAGIIKNSYAYNNKKTAIAHIDSTRTSEINNLFVNSANSTLPAVLLQGDGEHFLYHNTIVSLSKVGYGVKISGPKATIKNNIVSGFSNSLAVESGSVVQERNIFYDFGGASTTGISLGNSLSVDPSFVNKAAGNFHLSATSSAIDAATDVNVAQDREGVSRKNAPVADTGVGQITYSDIGAYEYQPVGAGSQSSSTNALSGPTNQNSASTTGVSPSSLEDSSTGGVGSSSENLNVDGSTDDGISGGKKAVIFLNKVTKSTNFIQKNYLYLIFILIAITLGLVGLILYRRRKKATQSPGSNPLFIQQ